MSEPVALTFSELIKKLTSPCVGEPANPGVYTLLVMNLAEYGSTPTELQKSLDKRFSGISKSSDEAKVRACVNGIANIICAVIDLLSQDKSLAQLNDWIYDVMAKMERFKERVGIEAPNKIKLAIIRSRQRRLKAKTYYVESGSSSSSEGSPRKSARPKTNSISSSSSSSSPALPRWTSSFLQAIMIFEHYEIDDFAARLSYSESRIFSQIKVRELKGQAWQKSAKEEKSPNIVAMVSRFNSVSYWIAENLCRIENLDDRVNNIIGLIELAGKLYDRNNFNGLMEVIGALNNIAVQRMKSTWEIVMQKCKSKWEYLNDLMDSANNYKKYRDTLAECTLPCVPFLGVFLRDLTFIEDGNQDFIKSKINFDKMSLVGDVLAQIRKFQSKRYPRPSRVKELDDLFTPVPEDSDDHLYEMSVIVEPRALSVDTGGAVAQSPTEPSIIFLTISATGGNTEFEFSGSFTLEDLLTRIDQISTGTVIKSITFKTLASTMRLNKATFLDFVATRVAVEGRAEYRLTLNISPKIDIETSCTKCVIRVTNDQGVIKDSMIPPSQLTVEGIGKAVKVLWPDVRYAFFKNEEGKRIKLDKLTFLEFVGTGKLHKKVAEYRLWIKRFK